MEIISPLSISGQGAHPQPDDTDSKTFLVCRPRRVLLAEMHQGHAHPAGRTIITGRQVALGLRAKLKPMGYTTVNERVRAQVGLPGVLFSDGEHAVEISHCESGAL